MTIPQPETTLAVSDVLDAIGISDDTAKIILQTCSTLEEFLAWDDGESNEEDRKRLAQFRAFCQQREDITEDMLKDYMIPEAEAVEIIETTAEALSDTDEDDEFEADVRAIQVTDVTNESPSTNSASPRSNVPCRKTAEIRSEAS